MAGLDPAISLMGALCPSKRDHRVKPGDDTEYDAPSKQNAAEFPPRRFVSA